MNIPGRRTKAPKPVQSPRAKVSGTGYKAKGFIPLSPADYNEAGSSVAGTIFNPVPELSVRSQQVLTFTKMYRSSTSVRMGIRAGEAPVVGGDYYIDPFSTEPIDVSIAEFVEFNLFGSPTVPFSRTIRGITNSMYRNGNAVREIVWQLQEWAPSKSTAGANRKQYTMLKKLAVRPSSTISEVQYDQNGGPTAVIQQAINPVNQSVTAQTIPINKAIIFPFEEDDGDLLGNSILLPAFEHWTYVSPLYKIDGIQKERHGIGIPHINLLPGYTADDKKYAHVVGRNLRTNEKAYVVTNPRFTVDFLEPKGQMVDALKSAEYHETQILAAIMLGFMNMGLTDIGGGGGRATAATSMDMFLKSMRYVGQSICDQINNYLIPQLVAYNFDTDNFPKLKVRNIGEVKDLQMWAAAMANLINSDAIIVDEDTENFIRAQVDMPKRTTPRPVLADGTTKVEELLQGSAGPSNGNSSGAATSNGHSGAGRPKTTGTIGKSPSSGAV